MDFKKLNKIIGGIVFAISAFVFFITAQASVSFWDCGEFIASAVQLQVPHPPGTPFFLLVGKVFSMIPFAENLAFRVNTVSVLSSAFTILFLYLIAVKLIENYRGKKYNSILEALFVYLPAAIGALSLSFSDTFWFNAVEAEVYAMATFFIAFVVWVLTLWNEKADEPDSERYIIFMAYLIGLSTGVHLMSVLAMVPIVMVIMFRKYLEDNEALKQSGYVLLGQIIVVGIISMIVWAAQTEGRPSPEEFKAFDKKMLLIVLAVSAVYLGIFYKKVFHKNSIYIPLVVGGIALVVTYPGMVKHIPNFISKIGGYNLTLDVLIIVAIFAFVAYMIYWTNKGEKQTLNLAFKCFLFAFIGFTSYTMIIIRSNQETPINLNSPKTFPEVVSYLNREQYGDFPILKRRYSQEPHQQAIYTRYNSDLDFLLRYQMNHMFNRYLLWNYAGRVSTVQDEGVNWSKFYGIPFLLGILGLLYHYKRDWKMASVFLVMFIFLGYLTAFYQNQQQPQPRERDYFYVGAFFVYSIWIALGVRGILEFIEEYARGRSFAKPVSIVVLALGFLLVPINMIASNFHSHNRSKNYVPWDYSYNMLQSVAPNAVIFTNGDNDTFPLWYLQDVEGVRRDVRVANLSLLNTPWYIKQLKNTSPYSSKKVAMNLSDRQIDNIGPARWEPRMETIPLTKKAIEDFNIKDSALIKEGKVSWLMPNAVVYSGVKALRVQDIVAKSIIDANNWERPIYFAVTCSNDSRLGLNDYLEIEGMALRLVPIKSPNRAEYLNEKIMTEQLFNEPEGYSKDYAPGFKFRGLNSKDIFFDETHQRLVQNYRNSFMRLALYYRYNKRDNQKGIAVLEKMEEKMPHNIVEMPYEILYQVSNLYLDFGNRKKFEEYGKEFEVKALEEVKRNPMNFRSYYNPYSLLFEMYETIQAYDKAYTLAKMLKEVVPNDKQLDQLISTYKSKMKNKKPEIGKETIPLEKNK